MADGNRLYRIEEFPEIFVDACLRDSEGQFMFLSIYGRDGSIMQFIAAMELGGQERGVQRFHLVNSAGERHPVDVGGTDRLTKHDGRLPRQNLFGPLSQMWVFDKRLQQPDRANRIAWVLHQEAGAKASFDGGPVTNVTLQDRVWKTIVGLSPVALLDHWRQPLLTWCENKRATQALGDAIYPAIGPVQAVRVSLTDHFVGFIRDGVKNRTLTL